MLDETNKQILDNDLGDIYNKICRFSLDNGVTSLKTINTETTYEFIGSNKLSSNIIDIKRYLRKYLDNVAKLISIDAKQIKNLGKIIKTTTKINKTQKYKYIDISEINSPLYSHKKLYGWELPSRAKYSIQKHDILISKLEGTMSYCVILDDSTDYIATNGVTVIRPNNLNALYILISNIMNKDFVLQHTAYLTGSIMASLSDSDIGEFLVDDKNIDIELTKKILETLETLQRFKL